MTGGDPPSSDQRLAGAARAAHDLSDALWHSLHEEISSAHRERASELAQRLADVCAAIALLVAPATPLPSGSAPAPGLSAPGSALAPGEPGSAPGPGERAPASGPGPGEPGPGAAPSPQSPLEPPEPARDDGIEVHDARPPELRPAHALGHGPAHASPDEEGPAAWIGSIGRRLERHREDRLPFAVLLIEVVDIDRLAHAESQQVLTRLTTQVERAIGSELRPADRLTHEALGRYWLVTPETDALGARQLAERLARTVRLAAQHRGVPLEIAIGIAICPDDGRDPSTLAAHADVGVYAARASGRSIAPDSDPAA